MVKNRKKIQLAPTQEGVATLEQIKTEGVYFVGELFENVDDITRELSDHLDLFNERLLARMKSMKDE